MSESKEPPPVDENQIIAERRAKLAALRASGPAFPNDFQRTHLADELHVKYGARERDTLAQENIEVAVAGRMMLKRLMGKASFATVQDGSGRIQFYVADDEVGKEAHDEFKRWDIGDIIAARGVVFKTLKGELSIRCTELRLLAKSLRPLPDKFHGLEDRELRYRQRYVDLIMSDETRKLFVTRSKAITAMRDFMVADGFLEVETPMLQIIPGGAAAKPFVTHHNALGIDMFLRIAPELFLKRLVVGGYERVFEINRNFRNEGMSPRHNPEFTMLEFYAAYQDYKWLMDFTERLINHVALATTESARIEYQGQTIELTPPFARLTTVQAIRLHAPQYSDEQLADRNFLHRELRSKGSAHSDEAGLGALQLAMFEEVGRRQADPAHLYRRLSGRSVSAGSRIRFSPRYHRAVRTLYCRPRNRERLFGVERSGRPGGSIQRTGEGEGCRRRRGDVLRRRLCARARVRNAAHRRMRSRHRSRRDDADRLGEHTRCHPVSAHETGSVGVGAAEAATADRSASCARTAAASRGSDRTDYRGHTRRRCAACGRASSLPRMSTASASVVRR